MNFILRSVPGAFVKGLNSFAVFILLFKNHCRFLPLGLACAGLMIGFPRARAGEFVLVEDGVAKTPLVVCEDAPPQTRKIADELAGFIEKISGVKPEVLEGRPEPLPESAVWVGYQPVLDELFPDLDFDFEHPEEILISTDGSHLVIAGRDRWDPDKIVTVGRRGNYVEGWQAEFGTVNAVYTFLRDQLEVRWLWPGETGLDILPMERIAFEPFEHRHHPQLRMRHGILRLSNPRDARGFAWGDWARFQRLFFDSLEEGATHHFSDWWDRFHESNPEYFALQPDGTRSGFPSPGRAKMCQSNPELWEQWFEGVETRLEEDPNRVFFPAGFNDSNISGFCICENCLAWDEMDASPRRLVWEGLSQEYVALSDREVRFANELARLLRERYPGKGYHVVTYAYGPTTPAPVKAVADENVVISYVRNVGDIDRSCPDETPVTEQIAGWAAAGTKMIYRPNLGGANANDLVHGQLPAVFFGKIMETFRFIADHRCIGVWIDTINEAWPTQGPFYYLMAHLAWDPYADGYAILDDYYRRGFGAAHEQVKAYWTFMEETRSARVEAGLSDSVGWRASGAEVYDEEFFRHAGRLLDEAEARLEGEPEIYRRRLAHVRAGLEFTRLRVDTYNQMERYRESREQDEEAADRVRANWAEMWRIGGEHMIYRHRLQNHRSGMHPEGEDMTFRDWKEPGDRRSGEIEQIP